MLTSAKTWPIRKQNTGPNNPADPSWCIAAERFCLPLWLAKFYQLSWQEYHDTLFPCSFSFLQKFKPQRDTDNLASQPSVPAGDTIHNLGHLSRKPVKIHWHHLPAKLSQFFSSTAFEFSHRPWTRTTHTINTADTASQLQITTTSWYQWTCFERCLLD